MKILSICGSPRRGNSEAIIKRLKEIFEQKGIENKIILLREKKYSKMQWMCRILQQAFKMLASR